MAIAHVLAHSPAPATQLAACCLTRADDARRLASAAAAVVTPGRVLDIGCGAGGIALPLLRARRDLSVLGVEVAPSEAAEAQRRAEVAGVAHRLRLLVGNAREIRLPSAPSAVANPPMLPGEPGFTVGPKGAERLFAHALVERLAGAGVRDIWLHQFDFLGIDVAYGDHPTLARVATAAGFEISFPHRGWRAVGQASAVRHALPALARLFPDAPARLGTTELPLARIPTRTSEPVAIRHTIARLHRPVITKGVPQ